jgi:hypothetical protein
MIYIVIIIHKKNTPGIALAHGRVLITMPQINS